MKVIRMTAVAAVATCLAATPTVGASAAEAPGRTCQTAQVPAGPGGELGPLAGEGGYFSKQGGCASTVAQGGLTAQGVVSSLTTRSGYVQTCQTIREVEGWGFTFDYPFLPLLPRPSDGNWTVTSIADCAETLKIIHVGVERLGPPPAP